MNGKVFNDLDRLMEIPPVANAPCLDFVNTIDNWFSPSYDYITNYEALLFWSERVFIVTKNQSSLLLAKGQKDAHAANKIVRLGARHRLLLHDLFASVASGSAPSSELLDRLHVFHAKAIANSKLIAHGSNFALSWDHSDHLAVPLFVIAHTAYDLLATGTLDRIKVCPTCGSLFYDTSKNAKRRWCSMDTCGVQDKMRRYHMRARQKRD